jgi:zinc/manganese transport system permease protein
MSTLLSAANADPSLSWDLVQNVRQLFDFPFMVNAFRAGTIVAILAGLVGWFMVLRRQSFAGHTLAVIGFPGAAAAVLLGVSATYGLLVFGVTAAVLIALVPGAGTRRYNEESAVTGTVQAFALALGFFLLVLSGSYSGRVNGLLFGTFLGITEQQVMLLLGFAVCALLVLAVIGRPLFFASVDPEVAAARGVPVRALSIAFLVLLGICAAEVSQVTGVLLVFALLVVPAATAQQVTTRPALSLALTVALGLGIVWSALFVAYYTDYPLGFYVTSIAFAVFVAVTLVTRAVRARSNAVVAA